MTAPRPSILSLAAIVTTLVSLSGCCTKNPDSLACRIISGGKEEAARIAKLPEVYVIGDELRKYGRKAADYAEGALIKLDRDDDLTSDEKQALIENVKAVYEKTRRNANAANNHLQRYIGGKGSFSESTLAGYEDNINLGLKELAALQANPRGATASGILTIVGSIEIVKKVIDIVNKVNEVIKAEKARAINYLEESKWADWDSISGNS